jgi:DivIVA domain-containing protein
MALSFSRPDPSSPDAIASASFSTGRRGYDQNEVRDLLRMVAAEMARLQEREKFLERELRSAQTGSTHAAVVLDEEVVTRMLGEEAASILQSAREAAQQIKNRTEDSATRMMREAADEAQRVREEAEVEAARRRQDATADAEAELLMAKQQGREMVNEARAYRERVLSELARRRELARQQIEQLMHGRDRLLQAFERSRLVAVDVMAELTPLGEPSEYVNLSPTTGPVPLMVPNLRPPDEAVEAESPIVVTIVEPDEVDEPDDADGDIAAEIDEPEVEPADDDSTVLLMRDMHEAHDHDEHDDARSSAPVVALFREDDDDELSTDTDEAPKASVDDLFARLRAARLDAEAEADAEAAPAAEEPAPIAEEAAWSTVPPCSNRRPRRRSSTCRSTTRCSGNATRR